MNRVISMMAVLLTLVSCKGNTLTTNKLEDKKWKRKY